MIVKRRLTIAAITSLVAGLVMLSCSTSEAQILQGQIDSFINGTADDWQEGVSSPNPPVYDNGLGPDGLPGHLQNISTGTGAPGSRMLMWNEDVRWTGDYYAAGVSDISLWADNRSGNGQVIDLRIAFNGGGGWFASNAFQLTDGSGWTNFVYDLSAMTHVDGGTGILGDTMTSVTQFEIFSAAGPPVIAGNGFLVQGDRIAADLRIDNISAIPEPAAAVLLALGGAGMLLRRRR